MITLKEIIRALKLNRYPFGMWAKPECYGTELGEAMQAKAVAIGKYDNFLWYNDKDWEFTQNHGFIGSCTYRLRSDYEEKPELRHGDYGIGSNWQDKDIDAFVYTRQGKVEKAFYSNGMGQINVTHAKHPILGNIFDDLKAIAEPLTEFEVGSECFKFNAVLSKNGRFNMSTQGCWMNSVTFDEIVLNLRRLQFTLRSKK